MFYWTAIRRKNIGSTLLWIQQYWWFRSYILPARNIFFCDFWATFERHLALPSGTQKNKFVKNLNRWYDRISSDSGFIYAEELFPYMCWSTWVMRTELCGHPLHDPTQVPFSTWALFSRLTSILYIFKSKTRLYPIWWHMGDRCIWRCLQLKGGSRILVEVCPFLDVESFMLLAPRPWVSDLCTMLKLQGNNAASNIRQHFSVYIAA